MDNIDHTPSLETAKTAIIANTDAAPSTPNAATLSQVQFDVDLSIYTQEALNYTCYDYAGRFYIEQTKALAPTLVAGSTAVSGDTTGNATLIHVTLLLKDATTTMSAAEATQIRHEFNQSLLDYQTRIDLEKHFGYIRDLLVAEAFKPVNS